MYVYKLLLITGRTWELLSKKYIIELKISGEKIDKILIGIINDYIIKMTLTIYIEVITYNIKKYC